MSTDFNNHNKRYGHKIYMDAQDKQDMGKEEGIPLTTNMANSHIMHKKLKIFNSSSSLRSLRSWRESIPNSISCG